MLAPKKVKHRKWQKGRSRARTFASTKTELSFGSYGLRSLELAWITSRQIEAARRAITHSLKKGGKVWIRIFPDKPITVKSAEVPMGGGKGSVDHYVAVVRIGTILFEIDGVSEERAKMALTRASHKLPVKTKFVDKK